MIARPINIEGQHCMKQSKAYSFVSRLVIVFFLMVICAWGGWLWWRDSISAPDARDTIPVIFVIRSGDGVKMIAANLAADNLIRSPTGFYLLVKVMGIERQLQAGEFRLKRSMDARSIALELTHGISDQWVTILEGWRNEEVAAKVAKDLDVPELEFVKEGKEGYMFPDTYLIPQDATIGAITKMFLDNFNKKVSASMQEEASKTGLTLDQVITLASIVEREGRSTEDRPVIAGILLKRLKADWPLQTDATLQYALGYQAGEKTWWKKELTDADKKIKSPYNTYENSGLPPKPICNPGLESIQAVINAKDSEYWYYIHDPTGAVHFATTVEEHNANVAQYLQ